MSRTRIPVNIRKRIRKAALYRCGYCLSTQRYVMGLLEIEHIIPLAGGGTDEEENLWLSCTLCNRFKGIKFSHLDPITNIIAPLFNPRTQVWKEHFRWDEAGVRIAGITPTGRATVEAIQLNNEIALEVRFQWVGANWHPPEDSL